MRPVTETIIALTVLAGVFATGYITANNSWQTKWAKRDATDARATKAFNEQQRRIEQERQGVINAIQEDAQKRITKAKRDADVANAESERLQVGIKDAIGRLNSGRSDTGTTAGSKAGRGTGLLLAELFREIDTAAGHYAAEADRARSVAMTCEAAYDSVRGVK